MFVIEYKGKVITKSELIIAETKRVQKGSPRGYVATLAHQAKKSNTDVFQEIFIDATDEGNAARFINHSCGSPNCRMEVWFVDGFPRIGIFALRDLKVGEPLTYSYNKYLSRYASFESAFLCACGDEGCTSKKISDISVPCSINTNDQRHLVAFSDGSEQGHKAGYGVIIVEQVVGTANPGMDGKVVTKFGGQVKLNRSSSLYIGAESYTNNAAELSGAFHALNWLNEDLKARTAPRVSLVTDSEYVLKILEGESSPKAHIKLAKLALKLRQELGDRLKVIHVGSHNGIKWNDMVDKLALKARKGKKVALPIYKPGYSILAAGPRTEIEGSDEDGQIFIKTIITPSLYSALDIHVDKCRSEGSPNRLIEYLLKKGWENSEVRVKLGIYMKTSKHEGKTDPSGFCGYEACIQAMAALAVPYSDRSQLVDDLRISKVDQVTLNSWANILRNKNIYISDTDLRAKVIGTAELWETGTKTIGQDSGLWFRGSLALELARGIPVVSAPKVNGVAWSEVPGHFTLKEAESR